MDTNRNGLIDFSGADRITSTISDITTAHGTTVHRTRSYVWPTTGLDSSILVSMTEASVDGLQTWQTSYRDQGTPVVSHSQTVYASGGARYHTNTAPDQSYSVSTFQDGRLASASRFDSLNHQLSSINYSYDSQGRQNATTDLRNGTTSYTFNDEGQISSVLTPPPVTGQSGQLTTNYFDKMGRIWKTTLPDGTSVTNAYDLTGAVTNKAGSREYPVAYSFDPQGRLQTMTTWTDYATRAGAATTTWNYDKYRGWLTNKVYADTRGPRYTYTPAGRLQTRVWARGVGTTNYYGADGSLRAAAYSDTTPGVTNAYDRRGRLAQISVGTTSTSSLAYNDANQLTSESYSGGPLNAVTVSSTFDTLLRRTDLAVQQSNNPLIHQSFGFDAASRLLSVSDNNGNSAWYNYLDYSPLVQQIAFTNNGSRRMVTTKQYDYLNRLTSISNTPSASSPIGFAYKYNTANQRTAITNSDATFWQFTYDSLGQVTSGKKYWPDGTPVAGQQFQYTFDDIGNRKTAASGGDATGGDLHSQTYSVNNLNEYTSRIVPGIVQSLGTANSNANVVLWGDGNKYQRAYRHGDYFWAELAYDNSANPLWISLTNFGVLPGGTNADIAASTKGHLFVPQTPEGFAYDYDGSLIADDQWNYMWDAENRLVKMAARTGAGPQISLQFDYDSQGRRIRKQVWSNTGWSGSPTNDLRFAYDGWNLISELDGLNSSALVRSYAWGLDLSGSPQGAGGIGGLLEISQVSSNYFATFDGNGNVMGVTCAPDGTALAHYEYGPFGERIRADYPASGNRLQFSTKYADAESDLLYYGERYYETAGGRWTSRDPVEHVNPYAFVENEPTVRADVIGLSARDTVITKLDEARANIAPAGTIIPSDLVMVTGFPGALSAFGDLAQTITAKNGDPGRGNNAKWFITGHKMIVRNGPVTADTIVHEMTHAVNDLRLHIPDDERMDEGLAWGIQSFYSLSVELKKFNDGLERSPCNPSVILGHWRHIWNEWGRFGARGWLDANLQDGTQAPLNHWDFVRIKGNYRVHLTCKGLANIVNQILAEQHCCYSVSCSRTTSSMEIGPDIQIDPEFQ